MESKKSPHLAPPQAYGEPPPVSGEPPPVSGQPTQAEGKWTTGLCDCFDDLPICCLTWCCPCITFGQIAEIVDQGSVSCTASGAFYVIILFLLGCSNCYSCFYRAKMRKQFLLPESPCGDCLVHCCCETCALCQEYRELKNRGYDMSLGWQGNVERQNRGDIVGMVPPPPIGGQGMTR